MYFERKAYLKELISAEGNGMIKIITGIRRCGKSFLLCREFLIRSNLLEEWKSVLKPLASIWNTCRIPSSSARLCVMM